MSSASVASIAALSFTGNANAEPVKVPAPAPAISSSAPAPAPDRVRVEHQVGTVLEGTSAAAGGVMVTLYENSLHGSLIQVVLGDPELDRIGYVEQPGAFIQDGRLDVTVDVQGTPVRLVGTVARSGRPTRVVERIEDGGERIVTRGTHTALTTDVRAKVHGTSAGIAFAPAFAFDLVTRTVTLHGR
jgi:hypothetical protein